LPDSEAKLFEHDRSELPSLVVRRRSGGENSKGPGLEASG
jgi:hypothetical protein